MGPSPAGPGRVGPTFFLFFSFFFDFFFNISFLLLLLTPSRLSFANLCELVIIMEHIDGANCFLNNEFDICLPFNLKLRMAV